MRTSLFLLLTVVVVCSAARATDVASCGAEIAGRDDANLTADLVCSTPFGITLGRHARLEMHGHTITMLGDGQSAIECANGCVVDGPGQLVHPRADVSVDTAGYGIDVFHGRLTASDLDVAGFGTGVHGLGRVSAVLQHVVAHDCAHTGIAVGRLSLTDVAANHNGLVVDVNRTGAGIGGARVTGEGITANDNVEVGLGCQNLSARDLNATGNMVGVTAIATIRLADSTVTGNSVIDLKSRARPMLTNTTCDHSEVAGQPGTSWGVCSLD